MARRRYDCDELIPIVKKLALQPDEPILLIHFGRGGIKEKGMLDAYNRQRVEKTIVLTRALQQAFPERDVAVLFTGRCNRRQARMNVHLPVTEADAALHYALELYRPGDQFSLGAEKRSTSTVENAIYTAWNVMNPGTIVALTDPLHYLGGRVAFIMRLVFPRRRILFVALPDRLKITAKDVVNQLVSAVITRVGMIGVAQGDLHAIYHRQQRLQTLERLYRP